MPKIIQYLWRLLKRSEKINDRKILLFIFFLSFLFRFIALMIVNFDYPYETQDYYENIARGNPFDSELPVYPIFIKLIYTLFGDHYPIVIIIQAIITSLLPVLVYKISKEIFSKDKAIIGSLIALFYPEFIFWNNYIISDVFYIIPFLFLILFSLRFMRTKSLYDILMIIVLSILCMNTRFVAITTIIICFGYIINSILKSKGKTNIYKFGIIIFLLLLSLMFLGSISNYFSMKSLNHFSMKWDSENMNSGSYTCYDLKTNCDKKNLTLIEKVESYFDRAYYFFDFYLQRMNIYNKIINFFTFPILYILSCFTFFRHIKNKKILFIVALIIGTAVLHTATFTDFSYRYRLPILPLLIILISDSIVYLIKKLRK